MDSFYDQFAGGEMPVQQEVETPFANRKDLSKPYVNRDKPKHVKEAMQTEQKDFSDSAWWRLFTSQRPKCSFEQSVNVKFGQKPQGEFNYAEKKKEYVSLYKKMMDEL